MRLQPTHRPQEIVSAPDKDRRILIVDPDDRFREGLPNFFGSWYDNLTRVAYYLAKNWNSARSAQRSFESFAYTKVKSASCLRCSIQQLHLEEHAPLIAMINTVPDEKWS